MKKINKSTLTIDVAMNKAKEIQNKKYWDTVAPEAKVCVTKDRWEMVLRDCVNAEAEVEYLQTVVDSINIELADLKESSEKKAMDRFTLQNELATIKSINSTTLADRENRIAKLLKDVSKLTDENTQFRINSEHLAKKAIRLQIENEMLLEDKQNLLIEKEKLSKNRDRLADEVRSLNGILERNTGNVQQLEKDLLRSKEKFKFMEDAVANLSAKLETAKSTSEGLEELKKYYEHIIDVQRTALQRISQGAMFKHSEIAHKAILEVLDYKIAGLQI